MTLPSLSATPHPARTIFILSLAPTIGLGIARFGYALVLPDMRDSFAWSYSAAGFMNTINAAGYLFGALVTAALTRRIGLFDTVRAGVIACIVSLALCAITSNFGLLSFARLLAGAGGAFGFIAGGALAAHIAQANPDRSAFLLGLYYGGSGVGIIVSGLVAPLMLDALGAGSWPKIWAAFALIGVALGLVLILKRIDTPATPDNGGTARIALPQITIYLFAYFCFGAGYIAYMTFMIAYVRDVGGSVAAQSIFWCLIGLGTIVSPWLWRGLLARGESGMALAVLLAINAITAGLPLLSSSPAMLAVSAFGFGAVFFTVVGATTAFARFNYPPAAWPNAIAVLAIIFGIGQTLGPIATGAISDALGSLSSALTISAVTLAVGAIAAAFQRPLAQSTTNG
ncbi:MAG: MFS transporter [Proteobacteria bacterium SG_bin9]|nr:MAG: MFS transporter [Proteobacteria bacterium SG_bin9]